jgi:hypothetical protein
VVRFTIGTHGEAANVALVATSGHAGLDEQLMKAVSGSPRWSPAQDEAGAAVEQTFAFRILQAGCDGPPPAEPAKDAGTGHLPVTEPKVAQDHPYDLAFTIEKADDRTYTLITTVKLHGGSYYASPNCTRDVKGKFHVELADQERIVLADMIKEVPLTVEGVYYHPLVNGPMDWVRVDTRYEQRLTVTSREDLEVEGKYRFTIEPRCTLEEIPFLIKQRSGVLTIERVGC